MAAHDSDSSVDEDNDYTETNVLLGYASDRPSDDTISHLGGRPDWLESSQPPSLALAKCRVCNDIMVLLLQLNGDLPEHFPGHERRLYILSCRNKTCRRQEGSVRVLRGTRISEVERKKKSKPAPKPELEKESVANIGATLFGAKSTGSVPSNPFSIGSATAASNPFSLKRNSFATASASASESTAKPPQTTSTESADLPKTFASALSIDDCAPVASPSLPAELWPSESSLPNPYPILYLIDADYEILDRVEEAPVPVTNMDIDEGNSGGGAEDKEVFESTLDKTFQKFADRLAQNPEQVLRYEFKGSPLLYSKVDTVGKALSVPGGVGNAKIASESGMPRCSNCGSARVFETQLTPHAIMELERNEDGIDGMEWGTIIAGVCERDCVPNYVRNGEVGYVDEWAGVQWEELNIRRQ